MTAPTVVAFANQKGGVAKTTSALSVAAAAAEAGASVLLVDLDPQACLTFALGFDPDAMETTVHTALSGGCDLDAATVPVPAVPGLHLVPANIDLAAAEAVLMARPGREYLLRSLLEQSQGGYDLVVVDCPPALGVLTLNGLTAAGQVAIPVACETLSHRGVSQLLATVDDVRRFTNRTLQVAGFIATMYDGRSNHSQQVLDDLPARYGLARLGVPVKRSVRFAEAPAAGQTILQYAPATPGADAYRIIARTLLGQQVDPQLFDRAGFPAAAA